MLLALFAYVVSIHLQSIDYTEHPVRFFFNSVLFGILVFVSLSDLISRVF